MKCEQTINYLSDYYEEDLPDGQRAQIQSHLANCQVCKECLEEIASIVLIARTLCNGSDDCPDAKVMFRKLLLVRH